MDEGGIIFTRIKGQPRDANVISPKSILLALASPSVIDKCDMLTLGKYEYCKWHYGCIFELGYSDVEWLRFSELLFDQKLRNEYCSCHSNEYGEIDLMCSNIDNRKQRLIFEHGGEDMSSDSLRSKFTLSYNRWKSIVSSDIQQLIPKCYFNSAEYFF